MYSSYNIAISKYYAVYGEDYTTVVVVRVFGTENMHLFFNILISLR